MTEKRARRPLICGQPSTSEFTRRVHWARPEGPSRPLSAGQGQAGKPRQADQGMAWEPGGRRVCTPLQDQRVLDSQAATQGHGHGRGQGPTGQNHSTARRPCRLSLRPWAGASWEEWPRPCSLTPLPPGLCPPRQAACPHQSLLAASPAISFPYIEFCGGSGEEAHGVPGGKKGPVPRDTSS